MKPLARGPARARSGRTRRAPAWASRPPGSAPCRNDGNRKSLRPRGGGWLRPRIAAGRTGCTSGSCGARPRSRSAVRVRPQACTSSAPKEETPTSLTQTGRSVTRRISSIFCRPLVDLPEVPVERKSVHGDGVDMVEHTMVLHLLHERRIDRRDAAKHLGRCAALSAAIASAASDRHCGEPLPVRVELRVPMRLVVGLVPDHRRLDHRRSSLRAGRRRAQSGDRSPRRQM